MTNKRPLPAIFGCAGHELSPNERGFFAQVQPFGFILMQRNCLSPAQVRNLVAELREAVGRADAPVFIDQEGGRVARLQPPHWPKFPSAGSIGKMYLYDRALGLEAAGIIGNLIGHELRQIGVTANCAPVLDIAYPETHQAIGDRAFAADPLIVAEVARAYVEGMLEQGILPVIKHLPGHGRATVDPHLELPVVSETREALAADFMPFRKLSALPIGMTSHILFSAIDPKFPASQSPAVIRDIIRGAIGFNGLLLSDDLDMKAVKGSMLVRAEKTLAAGTDIVLICNSGAAALTEAGTLLPRMTEQAWERWKTAQTFIRKPQFLDIGALNHRLDMISAVAEMGNSSNFSI